jgi:hypothetical protein
VSDEDNDIPGQNAVMDWLETEIRGVKKLADLRIARATEMAQDYAAGKIKPEDILDRMAAYEDQWMYTIDVQHLGREGASDEDLMREIHAHNADVEETSRRARLNPSPTVRQTEKPRAR